VVEESAGAAVDRGGGVVGRGTDRVAARRPRPAEGGGRCGGRGGRRWPPGASLAGKMLHTVVVGQRQEQVQARGGWPEEARAATAGARRAWCGGRRGHTGRALVGVRAAAGVGRVCGPGEDSIGGRAREDGGQVRETARAEAGAQRAGGGWGAAAGAEAGARWTGGSILFKSITSVDHPLSMKVTLIFIG
jgi:hypothetical protein